MIQQSEKHLQAFYEVMIKNPPQGFCVPANSEKSISSIYRCVYGKDYNFWFASVFHEDGKLHLYDWTYDTGKNGVSVISLYNKKYCKLALAFEKLGCKAFFQANKGLLFTDSTIVCINGSRNNGNTRIVDEIDILTADKDEAARLLSEIDNLMPWEERPKKEIPNMFGYVSKDDSISKIDVTNLQFKNVDVEISATYNDDLPYDTIISKLRSDKSELIIFDGKPGTGKTTLLKKIAYDLKDKKIFFFDTKSIPAIPPSDLVRFFIFHNDAIFIIEDCEDLLRKREKGNAFMSVLLNITDGFLADAVRAKFICTLNCKEENIDEAILRKGRLSLKYTFNPLSLEKTRQLVPEATKPMTLAEIFNNGEENITNKKETTKIGF